MDAERLEREAPKTIEIHPLEIVDKRKDGQPGRHVGDALACWWLDALGVETAVRNSMRGRKVGYNLDAALRLIICERLIEPGSKLAAVGNAQRHFFRSDLTDEIFALVGEKAPRKWMRTKDIKALFKKGKKVSWG